MHTPSAGLAIRLQRLADRTAMVASMVAIGACYAVIIVGGAIIMAVRLAPQRS